MSGRLTKAHPSYEDSSIRWIGAYPSSWNLTRVKFESYVKARVGWHGLKSDDFTDEGPYLVTGTDFSGSRINWQDCHHCDEWRYDQDPYIQLHEGDLLVTKDGTIGKLALVEALDGKATLNSGVFVVRPLTIRYISRFYFWLLQASVFHGFVDYRKTGSTIVHLYQETFENFSFAMPPVEEQTLITKFLDYETAKIDALIEKQQQLIALLKEKRQAVISHAVTKGLNPDVPMRNSGVEWLGEVPAHWRVGQLRRWIREMEQGKSPECESRPAEDAEWGVLKTGCVNRGIYAERENKALLPHFLPEIRYEVQAGDVLMSRASGSTELIGSVAFVNTTRSRILLSDKIFRLHFEVGMESQYFTNLMASSYMRSSIVRAISGAEGMANNITKTAVLAFSIVLPPIDEQRSITAHIHKVSSRISHLTDNASLMLAVLAERRTALISAAVTGKIDVRSWKEPEAQTAAEVA